MITAIGDRSMRFDRMERTEWISMDRIHRTRVFVAGAGALGNEVLKNLILAGFRDIVISDPDIVEESNLSRCILFRRSDIGLNKADVASASANEVDPDCNVVPVRTRLQEMDLGGFDMFLGCLDNIQSRLHLNSFAMHSHTPYVDGATDGFRGKVQVVFPNGPCLECGMNRTHLNELHRTFSCDPSTPGKSVDPVILSSGITTTAVIAGMCVREAIKIACGRTDLCVSGVIHYNGIRGTAEVLDLARKSKCPNHEGVK